RKDTAIAADNCVIGLTEVVSVWLGGGVKVVGDLLRAHDVVHRGRPKDVKRTRVAHGGGAAAAEGGSDDIRTGNGAHLDLVVVRVARRVACPNNEEEFRVR